MDSRSGNSRTESILVAFLGSPVLSGLPGRFRYATVLIKHTFPWPSCCGGPLRCSNGHHGNSQELIEHLEPLLKQYRVQVWSRGEV